jgi:adenylate cyclase
VTRLELEEAISPELLAVLWPLTEGRRVSKRRWRVPEGELCWEIDEFTDRELVLAEVELPTADHPVVFPSWLAPLVVREVTHEPAYLNLNRAVTRR